MLLLAGSGTAGADERTALSPAFRILSEIRSPYDMLSRKLPAHYTVPVVLSGPIADDMRASLTALKIRNPQYVESFDNEGRFKLSLAGSDIDTRTKEMLSGILNPAEMTEAVLGAVLRYKDPAMLLRMQAETKAIICSKRAGDTILLTVTLKPSGSRFGYTYRDLGNCVTESWLSELAVTVDSARHLVREVSLLKSTNTSGGGEDSGKRSVHQRFVMGYAANTGSALPDRLDLSVDYRPTLSITASYRSEKGYALIDRRTMSCYMADGKSADLVTSYGEYRFELGPVARDADSKGFGRAISEASTYARKAAQAMNKGDIAKAVAIYRAIERGYPGTPQAVEAKKLLEGIPRGF